MNFTVAHKSCQASTEAILANLFAQTLLCERNLLVLNRQSEILVEFRPTRMNFTVAHKSCQASTEAILANLFAQTLL